MTGGRGAVADAAEGTEGPRGDAGEAPLRRWIQRRIPLVVLGAGAASTFISNVAAKRGFTPAQFVDWAYLSSLATIFFSFSLLGSEQLVVRCAFEAGGKLALPRRAAAYIAGSFVAFMVVYAVLLDGRMLGYRLGLGAVPVLVGVGATQLVYQVERARGRLLTSQLAMNGWKIVLLPAVAVASMLPVGSRPEWAMGTALLAGVMGVAWIFHRTRPGLAVVPERAGDVGRIFLPFTLSLGLMAALGTADRILLEKVHRPEAFAGYVYLATILAGPFNVLAGYFGFKEAVRYRHAYTRAQARRDAVRIMAQTLALVIAWGAFCFATRGATGLAFDPLLWPLLSALAVLRCGYGVLSAAIGVRGSPATMYWVNAATLVALGGLASYAVAAGASVQVIVAGYVGVWLVRFAVSFGLLDATSAAEAFPNDAAAVETPNA